eukprot:TRINITY_DN5246_c0_g1_i1.p1 TRINITY_DN5246_c0_g1~~TRINITY_DN5246_c0_g1_i1.p1  ORF type:complete len:623 (-),score=164.50 TRINITY_DN5246_c0_g1_i1:39-1907(-)
MKRIEDLKKDKENGTSNNIKSENDSDEDSLERSLGDDEIVEWLDSTIEEYKIALETSKKDNVKIEATTIQNHMQEMFLLKDKIMKEDTKESALRESKAARKLNKYNLVETKKSGWGKKKKHIFTREKSGSLPIQRKILIDTSEKNNLNNSNVSSPKSLRMKLFSKSPSKKEGGGDNLVEWSDRWEKKEFKVSTLNKMKWENTDSEEDKELIEAIQGWSLETGKKKPCSMQDGDKIALIDPESYHYLYRDYFYKHSHSIYYGESKDGPVVICIEKGSPNTKSRAKYRVLMLDKREYNKYSIEKSSSARSRLKLIQQITSKKIGEIKLNKIDKNSLDQFSASLVQFEKKMKDEAHTNKFGILYAKEGQCDEDSIYGNENGSVFFKEFLSIIGKKIKLQGHKGFRGGLDNKNNTTGTKSIFNTVVYTKDGDFKGLDVPLSNFSKVVVESELNNSFSPRKSSVVDNEIDNGDEDIAFQVMFHVGIHLPYEYEKSDNPQQIGKKRHIGNDIVAVIFKEGNSVFNPSMIKSNYNHIFMIVSPRFLSDEKGVVTHYKVALASKRGVKPWRPFVPPDGLIEKKNFAPWFLTKLINAERAAMYAPEFSLKNARTIKKTLGILVEDSKKNEK